MSYELEYFTEFLNDPSVPGIDEFFRMVHLWIFYIQDHKADFNYLEDDEWKEIRERLIAEMDVRFDVRDELEWELEDLLEEGEKVEEKEPKEVLEYGLRKLNFLKNYRNVFRFDENEIIEFEAKMKEYEEELRQAWILDEQIRALGLHINQSVAELDEQMNDYFEKTGKRLILPKFTAKKVHKGN